MSHDDVTVNHAMNQSMHDVHQLNQSMALKRNQSI